MLQPAVGEDVVVGVGQPEAREEMTVLRTSDRALLDLGVALVLVHQSAYRRVWWRRDVRLEVWVWYWGEVGTGDKIWVWSHQHGGTVKPCYTPQKFHPFARVS